MPGEGRSSLTARIAGDRELGAVGETHAACVQPGGESLLGGADQIDERAQPPVVLRLRGKPREPARQRPLDELEELTVGGDPHRRLTDGQGDELGVGGEWRSSAPSRDRGGAVDERPTAPYIYAVIAANAASDWAQIAVTVLLGFVTVYIGLSIRQKRRQEIAVHVADHRLDAYAALWSKIPLSPELRKLRNEPPLTPNECRELFNELTAWYYGDGHGMLLGLSTRSIYLTVKTNLVCNPDQFVPISLIDDVRRSDDARSEAIVRQLSLLRSSMRADLEVYGKPWGKPLSALDREFLYACRVPGWRVQRTLAERRRWLVDRLRRRTRPTLYRPPEPADERPATAAESPGSR
jgi:hypothetical protein